MRSNMRARIGGLLLGTSMLLTLLPTAALAAEPSFTDIQEHWGKSAIERWSSNHVVDGKGNGIFDPDAQMTRAELAQMYVNLLHLTEKADIGRFGDVPADAWYADAIAKCVAAGILSGTGSDTISPLEPVTREQTFAMFARALGIKPSDTTRSDLNDLMQVSDWAKGAVYALLDAGYISGVGNNILMPLSNIDRASVAALLDAGIAGYAGEPGTTLKLDDKAGIALIAAKDVTVTGTVGDIVLTPGAAAGKVTLKDATVTGAVTVGAPSVQLNITEKSQIEQLVVNPQAGNAAVTVDKGASVSLLTTGAAGTAVSGQGTVKQVVAAKGSAHVTVNTSDTTVKNDSSEPVATNKGDIKPGETADTPKPSTGGSSSGGGSIGGGGGSAVVSYTVTFASNGGSGAMEQVSVVSGSTYNLPACTFQAPVNQKFKAWKVGEVEYAVGNSITVNDNVTVTAVWEDTAAKQAVDAAWAELGAALAEIKGHGDAQLVTIAGGSGAYTMTLDVDAIQAAKGAFTNEQLTVLATAVKTALDKHFGSYTLTMNGQNVYISGAFQNTALKNALFSVADGFFHTLSKMDADSNGVYTYKTVNAKAAGTDAYDFTVAVQLKGEDVAKVKRLASLLADHLTMEKLSAEEIKSRYGLENIGETEAVVVTMEMPDALMKKAAEIAASKSIRPQDMQDAFDRQTVSTYLDLLNHEDMKLDAILGSGADGINSVLSTLNSNANLINKVLSKMTVKVQDKNFFTAEHGTFAPGSGSDAYHNFMAGVIAMTSADIKSMTPAQFKCTEGSKVGTYYAIPITMEIDLGASMGFRATETVIVVLHIDFSQHAPTAVTAET